MHSFRLYALLSICWVLLSQMEINAQCTLEAFPDTTICGPGAVPLSVTSNGQIRSIRWQPATGLSNPTIPNPVANVSSTTTYTVKAEMLGPNLIQGGNFSGGGGGFTSDYTETNNLLPEGTYAVVANPASVHPNFAPCGDHTSGSGEMMVVNGNGTPNANVWCYTVAVDPNTDYDFSCWVTSVIAASPAILQFSINGVLIGAPFNAPGVCEWSQFATVWNSGASDIATICIVNQNTALSGNDFALDDIYFAGKCEAEAEVTIEVINLTARVNPAAYQLSCLGAKVTLKGTATSGPGITYLWTTPDGNIVSDETTLNPVVDQPGTYILTVTYDDGTIICTKEAQAVVTVNAIPFTVGIPTPPMLTCDRDQVRLTAQVSPPGGSYNYTWNTVDGNFLGSPTGNPVSVDAPGYYQVDVEDLNTGCLNSAFVQVFADTTKPKVDTRVRNHIDCINKLATIDSVRTTGGPGYNYFWTAPPGTIVSGQNTPSLTVNAPGTYVLVVTNTITGCAGVDTAVVLSDTITPRPLITFQGAIDCKDTEVVLFGSATPLPNPYTFSWSASAGGSINGPSNGTSAIAVAAGTYTLTATNSRNGCQKSVSVQVNADNAPPLVNIQVPGPLTCKDPQITLTSNGSSTGTNFNYLWTTTTGSINGSASGPSILVQGPGSYTLRISNTTNHCEAVATVIVNDNSVAPQASIGSPGILDCKNPVISLNGSTNLSPGTYTVVWTTPDGNVLGGATSLNPLVDEPGTYVLVVTSNETGCSTTQSVTVNQDPTVPVASISGDRDLTCTLPNLVLRKSGNSNGARYQVQWLSLSGAPLGTQDSLNVSNPGSYVLRVTDTQTGCVDLDTVAVNANKNIPAVEAGNGQQLTCSTVTATIGGSNPSANTLYTWFNATGNLSSGPGITNITVAQPGTYYLRALDQSNGCIAMDSVTVTLDTLHPRPILPTPQVLTCQLNQVLVNANNVQAGWGIQWLDAAGNAIPGATGPQITVSNPGPLSVLVINPANGCSTIVGITVLENADRPEVNIPTPGTLTCVTTEVGIEGVPVNGETYVYRWNTSGGNILSGAALPEATVNRPGLYELVVTDPSNGCTRLLTVNVPQNINPPSVEAGTQAILNCGVQQLTINGANADNGAGFDLQWSTPNGVITNGQNTLAPQVSAPGWYFLHVTNTLNGCSSTDSVQVLQDANAPIAVAATPGTITCSVSSLTLSGAGSSSGPDIVYGWSTANGSIQSGQSSLAPVVTAPGIYQIEVTNTANGCITRSTIQVGIDTMAPVFQIDPPALLTCARTQTSLSATGNASQWQWLESNGSPIPGATQPVFTTNVPGQFQLLGTNNVNGCRSLKNITVGIDTLHPMVLLPVIPALTCRDSVRTVLATISQANQASINWSATNGGVVQGPANSPSLQVNRAGSYQILVANPANGCATTRVVSIAEDKTPPQVVVNNALELNCVRQQIQLVNTSPTQPGDQLTWLNPQGQAVSSAPQLQITAPGIYTLRVVSERNGCQSLDTTLVNENTQLPVVSLATPEPITCTRSAVILNATGSSSGPQISINWTGPAGGIQNGSFTLTPQVILPGTYTLILVDASNGCQSTLQTVVHEEIKRPTGTVEPPELLHCLQEEVILQGQSNQSGVTFDWLSPQGVVFAANSPQAKVSSVGNYQMRITDPQNGCTTLVPVTVQEAPPVAFIPRIVQPGCVNPKGQINLDNVSSGTPPLSYSFDGGQNFSFVEKSRRVNPGTYTVVVKDAYGCTLSQPVNIKTVTFPFINPLDNVEVKLGDKVQLSVVHTFNPADITLIAWTPASGLSCSDCLEPVVTAFTNTLYTLRIRDKNGCEDEIPVQFKVDRGGLIWVPNAFSPNADGANDGFTIYAAPESVKEVTVLRIFDRWGAQVFQRENFQPNDERLGWDGYHRGVLENPAVFTWVAKVRMIDGQETLIQGDVTLMR